MYFYLKKTKILFIVLLIIALLFIAFMPITQVLAEENKLQEVENFINRYNLTGYEYTIKELTDFSDNKYLLYEFSDNAYAIFAEGEKYRFVEGSVKENSPYYNFESKELYYLGPLSYYVLTDKGLYNIVENKYENIQNVTGAEYDYQTNVSKYQEQQIVSSNNVQKSKLQSTGMEIISYGDYFKETTYPSGGDGTCGVIAISMLLGFFDTYYNDNFVDSEYIYRDVKYFDELSELNEWKPTMVGTKDSFHDLIFNNYMHYNKLFASMFGGHPMADMELKDTMIDYLNSRGMISKSDIKHYSGSIVNTHANPASYLKNQMPVILVLSEYDHQTDKSWHCVVAYGYDEQNDTFMVNYGWGARYNEVILSKYTCYAYYAMQYSGGHVHSKNAYGTHGFKLLGSAYIGGYNKCGCGYCVFDKMQKIE